MDQALLEKLIAVKDTPQLAEYVEEYSLTCDDLYCLKQEQTELSRTSPKDALRIGQLAYEIGQLLPEPGLAIGAWILGNALALDGQYSAAKKYLTASRQEFIASEHILDAARTSVMEVAVLGYLGEANEAIRLADGIYPILLKSGQEDIEDKGRAASVLLNQGLAYEFLGRYEDAIRNYKQHEIINSELSNSSAVGRSKNNQAYALMHLNEFEDALQKFDEAGSIFSENGQLLDLIRLYINQGLLLVRLQRYTEAESVFFAAQAVLPKQSDMEQHVHRLTKSRVLLALERTESITDASVFALNEARRFFESHGPVINEGITYILIGRIHASRRNYSNAVRAYESAISLKSEPGIVFSALTHLGMLENSYGNASAAIEHYESAIQLIERVRQDIQTEMYRIGFFVDKMIAYKELSQIYSHSNQSEDAFRIVEQAKSRLLAERMAYRLQPEVDTLIQQEDHSTAVLAQRLSRLLDELESRDRQQRFSEGSPHSNQESRDDNLAELTTEDLEEQAYTLIRHIQSRKPLFALLANSESTSVENVCDVMTDGEAFLNFFVLKEQLMTLMVSPSLSKPVVTFTPLENIQEAQEVFRSSTNHVLELANQISPNLISRFVSQLLNDIQDSLRTLYQYLIEPVEQELSECTKLIISPDSFLHNIPFQALYDGEQYLLERYEISYTPSATVLLLCQQRVSSNTDILLAGYEENGSTKIQQEIEDIQAHFHGKKYITNSRLTTDELLKSTSNFGLIHIASHAVFRFDKPMLSYLALADRQCTLAEIARLQLQASLVVLSGCETGYGRSRGSELLSLAGGFLGAGASALLVSLWRVEGEITAIFMDHFYRFLNEGENYRTALRRAQLAILSAGRDSDGDKMIFQHPAYWASFILLGNWKA